MRSRSGLKERSAAAPSAAGELPRVSKAAVELPREAELTQELGHSLPAGVRIASQLPRGSAGGSSGGRVRVALACAHGAAVAQDPVRGAPLAGGGPPRGRGVGGRLRRVRSVAAGRAHRRSLSDSVAFVEVAPADSAAGEFERLDDDQLRSMFPDEAGGGSSSAPGSENGGSSDGGGDKRGGDAPTGGATNGCDDERNEATDAEAPATGQAAASTELIRDPKRVKR